MVLKRCCDILISAVVLLAASPLLALLAVVVWLDAGWPVLFSQERVGRGFRRFRIHKFRSMRTGKQGPSITVGGDSRITRSGAVLRIAKLDELPQFWNVLVGDMSLVGPRPEVHQYVQLFREQYCSILTVRPGITDLASIRFRNEERILSAVPDPERHYREVILPAKLDLAAEYVSRRSLALDLKILIGTVKATICG